MDSKPVEQLKPSHAELAEADATHQLPSSNASSLIERRMRRYQLAFGVANFAVSSS